MLIEFSVENFRSIREKITFSLVASEDIETLSENTFAVPGTDQIRLLKTAVIYGANAAGKSNLVRAMLTLIITNRLFIRSMRFRFLSYATKTREIY